mgnify:CR=1 FL=1
MDVRRNAAIRAVRQQRRQRVGRDLTRAVPAEQNGLITDSDIGNIRDIDHGEVHARLAAHGRILPAQEHLRAVGKGAGITVGIANRQHGHARGARGGEGAAVADALARCDRADVNDPGIPRQHGLEPERTRTRGAVAHAEGEHAGTHHLAAVLRVKGDPQKDGRYDLYAIKVATADGKAPLDGSVVVDAVEQYAQRGAEAEVSMTMNGEGAREWARLTGENIGKCIAIVLDGYVYSAPVVRTKIDKGTSSITGGFSIQEAKDLANVLKSGKVPAPAKIIQDTVVGPSLGQASINAGMLSFVVAFILVLLYMGLFYKTAGWMADIALLSNVFLLMGVLVSFGAVLTLPGIAGIVLTMGMAVDANVIIYERIKEELRGGKGLSLAIKEGFSKAYSAIIDGQLTTIITGIVLFIFGNGPVQGFATTLIIGIITSVFCAIFITRMLIEWVVAKWGSISFSHKWSENFLNNTHFDFLRVRKISYVVTIVLMLLSCISFFVRGLNLGAEFTGGRAYVVRFDKAVSAEHSARHGGAHVLPVPAAGSLT